jgi:DNA-binding NtrC family response regulator
VKSFLPGYQPFSGVELTEAIQTPRPDIVVLWITAYGCHNVYAERKELAVYRRLDKPLEINEIRQATREALEDTNGRNAARA